MAVLVFKGKTEYLSKAPLIIFQGTKRMTKSLWMTVCSCVPYNRSYLEGKRPEN